jgi:hypothetical protein
MMEMQGNLVRATSLVIPVVDSIIGGDINEMNILDEGGQEFDVTIWVSDAYMLSHKRDDNNKVAITVPVRMLGDIGKV